MRRPFRSFVPVALVLGAAVVLAAQAPLNMKPGQWEMTMQVDMPNGPPGVDTSKMTPQQKAQMDAIMKGRGLGAGKPIVTQSCVTREDLAQNRMQQDPPNSSCTTKVTKSTATTTEMIQTCTGAAEGTREIHVEAPSPTSMKMVAKATAGRGEGTTVTMTGKWLSDKCEGK
jgi:Spy/CpxP family protein refolding chaperone